MCDHFSVFCVKLQNKYGILSREISFSFSGVDLNKVRICPYSSGKIELHINSFVQHNLEM